MKGKAPELHSLLAKAVGRSLLAMVPLAALSVPTAAFATTELERTYVTPYIEPTIYYGSYYDWTGWYDDNMANDLPYGGSNGLGGDTPVCDAIRAEYSARAPGCDSNNAGTAAGSEFPHRYAYDYSSGIGRLLLETGNWSFGDFLVGALERHTENLAIIVPLYEDGEEEIEEADRNLIIDAANACNSFTGTIFSPTSAWGCWSGVAALADEFTVAHLQDGRGILERMGFTQTAMFGVGFSPSTQNSLRYKREQVAQQMTCKTFVDGLRRNGCI